MPIYSVAAVLVVAFLATSIFLLLSNDDSLEDSDAAQSIAELPPATTQALAPLSEAADFPTTVLATSQGANEAPAIITQAPAADDTSFDATDLSSSDSPAAPDSASETAPALAPPNPEGPIGGPDLELTERSDITAADMDDGSFECPTAEEDNLSSQDSAELAESDNAASSENAASSDNRQSSPGSPSTTVPTTSTAVTTTTVRADSEFQPPPSTSSSTPIPETQTSVTQTPEPTWQPLDDGFQLECP